MENTRQLETKAAFELLRDMLEQKIANNEFLKSIAISRLKGEPIEEHFLVKELRFKMQNKILESAIEKLENDIEAQDFDI